MVPAMSEGSMTADDVVPQLHEIARSMKPQITVPDDAGDSLNEAYQMSSIEALEFLLIVEERFDVTFEDEDLSVETVSSASKLADYVARQLRVQSG